jgi:soluble lytic murein transglycosylase-like protein
VLPSAAMLRPLTFVLVAMLAASSAFAQVRLVVGTDGRKLISNFGASASAHAGDLKWLAKQRNRRSAYDAMIDRYSVMYGVDPVLVRAVIQVESDFNPQCVSNKGARGLMQLMPETARRYGVRSIHDPEENIRGGVRYLGDLLEMFNSDLPRALAAYNAGEGAVLKYAGIPPYAETGTYVKRALTVYYGQPYGQSTATAFAGGNGGKLKGGFMSRVVDPVAAALLPGMRYLGSR